MHLLLRLAVVLMMQAPLVALQNQNGTASGVIRTSTGVPAAGVRVAAVALPGPDTSAGEGALLSLTQTDSAGHFRLDNILPGHYYIQAGLIDAPTYYPGVTTTSGATNILITAGAAIDDINFTMARGSGGIRVSGRLPTSAGRPALIRMTAGSGAFLSTSTQVKADGTFEFLKVTPGSYTLSAVPANGLPSLPIVVSDQDIDVGLSAGPGVKVSGVVGLGPHSPRPAGQKVVLIGSSAWAQMEASPASDGTFSITNVPPGIYNLRTTPGSIAPLATVVVADRDITSVSVAGYAELTGKAVFQDGRKFLATPTALMIVATPQKGPSLATVIGADGTIRFPIPEGQYRIALGKLPAGTFVKSISYGSIDLLKDPLLLDGSAEQGELRVVLEMD
jgi:hypothetical protein